MTRVSENSNSSAMQFAINKAKTRMEDLQLRGSNLRKVIKPSDDPVSNVEALSISSTTADNGQYLRNINYGLMQLNITEKALEQVTEIMSKVKELAVAQSSDFYNGDIRKNVSNEVIQLKNQLLALANKRIGNRYIFGGTKTLNPPFDHDCSYRGNDGKIRIEVAKDFFVPINLDGAEIFTGGVISDGSKNSPIQDLKNKSINEDSINSNKSEVEISNTRDLASINSGENEIKGSDGFNKNANLFAVMDSFIAALENNDSKVIQNILEAADTGISRLITLRTKIGSITNLVNTSQDSIDNDNIEHATRRSQLVDADIAELFSDITKQQQVLETTYKSGQHLMNQSLLTFLR